MARALAQGQTFNARVPVAIGGRRRFFDICALDVGDGSAGIAIDSSEATELTAALVRMADAHRRMARPIVVRRRGVRRRQAPDLYNDSYRRLWDLDRAFSRYRP